MLRDTITADQRGAVLRINDVWHRLSSYPDHISGFEIYTADPPLPRRVRRIDLSRVAPMPV